MTTGTTATYTTVGLNLIAGAQLGGPSAQVTYMAIGTGATLLSVALTAGTSYTTLGVNTLSSPLAQGQVLALVYQTNVDFVTLGSAASAGATSLTIQAWTPSFSFPAGSGLVNQPSLSDTQLQNEVYRVALGGATAGTTPGEVLLSGYCDPVLTPSGTYLEVGFFADPAPTPVTNSGTLIARGVGYDNHTQNQDSAQWQLDGVL